MYESHFGLTAPPFSISPDLRFLYMSEQHREGLAHLLYGIQQPGGFVQLTGEVGTGKTTLCRCLLKQLPPEVDVALILNPRVTPVEFLATVCDELRIAYPAGTESIKVLVDAIHRYLLEAHARGRRTVLVIDEAQNLSADVLEQIRLLTNLETTTEKLLQIILIGQPEMAALLEGPKLRQLAQRITARCHLRELSRQDSRAYIAHRLQVAGGGEGIFTPLAVRLVHRLSGGVPRLINAICDRALLGAYAHNRRRVTFATVRRAGAEVRGGALRSRRLGRVARACGLTALGAGVAWAVVLATAGRLSLLQGDGGSLAPPGGVRAAPASSEGGRALAGSTRLKDLLADPTLRADGRSAFAILYALLGVDERRVDPGLGCEAGRSLGIECLHRLGAWKKVRRYDRPAILELVGPTGERQRVVLAALGEQNATLRLGNRSATVPLQELDEFWDGSFTLLWKVPPLRSRVLSTGMRGEDVEWVWRRLDLIAGREPERVRRDAFDEELRRRLIAFQRSWSLAADGVVGEETLAHLVLAVHEPDSPSLSRGVP